MDLDPYQWSIIFLCGAMIGISKTGIPGVGILVVPLLASVIPARASVGVLLPLLVFGDIFAVVYYRRHAVWSHIVRILPWGLAGIIVGYYLLERVADTELRPIIGVTVLIMIAVNYWRNSVVGQDAKIPTQWWFAATLGFAAGVTTAMANAGGPVFIIYLLAMRLEKHEFIGTGAWYFLILNTLKIPFLCLHVPLLPDLGLINAESLRLDLYFLPMIVVGALIGKCILTHLSQKVFIRAVEVFTIAAALNLIGVFAIIRNIF